MRGAASEHTKLVLSISAVAEAMYRSLKVLQVKEIIKGSWVKKPQVCIGSHGGVCFSIQ